MKLLTAVLFILGSSFAFNQTFNFNTKDANVNFTYVSEKTKGTIGNVSAVIKLDYGNLKASTVEGTADVTTLSTENKSRDKHLQSPDFFNAAKYPKMKFVASEIIKDGDDYKAKGKLTIKDVTKDVEFTIKEGDNVLYFKTVIYGSDFGVSTKKDRNSSKIYVTVRIPTN